MTLFHPSREHVKKLNMLVDFYVIRRKNITQIGSEIYPLTPMCIKNVAFFCQSRRDLVESNLRYPVLEEH